MQKLVLPEGVAPSPQGSKPCMLIDHTTGGWCPRLELHQRPSPSHGDALLSCAAGTKLMHHAPARTAWKAVAMRSLTEWAPRLFGREATQPCGLIHQWRENGGWIRFRAGFSPASAQRFHGIGFPAMETWSLPPLRDFVVFL